MTSISSTSNLASSILSLDTNGDGVVSAEELEAAESKPKRSQDPTVESDNAVSGLAAQVASTLINSLLEAASVEQTSGKQPSHEEMFTRIDTDGDGEVTEAEFIASRPAEMSEEDATTLFAELDPEGTGSLSQEQFVAAMEANRPMASMGPPADSDDESEDDTLTIEEVFDRVAEVIAQYRALAEQDPEPTSATTL